MSKEIAKRLANLKDNLVGEPDKNSLYAQDLKASIKSCEQALQFANDKMQFYIIRGS